jgi:hypothetical protein
VEVEPYIAYEHMVEQDALFHKIILQHLNGIHEGSVAQSLKGNEEAMQWWNNFLHSRKDGFLRMISGKDVRRFEELTLSIPMGEFRLLDKYDLLLILPEGKAQILQWMTGKANPERRILENRVHTRVAPFVLTGAYPNLMGGKQIDPDKIELIYWFADQPDQPETFSYSQSKYQEDEQYLSSLTGSIKRKEEPVFPLTPDVRRCLFCTYRSFCDRGTKPGEFEDWMDWLVTGSADADIPDYNQMSEPGG